MEDMGIHLSTCKGFRTLVLAGWTIRSIRTKLLETEGRDLSSYSDIELVNAARTILKEM